MSGSKKTMAISCFAVSLLLMFVSVSAYAWSENDHRIIVSDSLDYMAESGDEFLESIAEWFWFAPGYNHLIYREETGLYNDARCDADAPYYSAACAIRDEAANTDHYSDMYVEVDIRELSTLCMSPVPVLSQLFCYYLGQVKGRGLSSGYFSSFMGYNFTSLNHFIGARYASDEVARNLKYDPVYQHLCELRGDTELRGYKFKNLGGNCDEYTEGDCNLENEEMDLFARLSTDDKLSGHIWLDPESPAIIRYNDITCHHYDFQEYITEPGSPPELGPARVATPAYIPTDSLVDHWMSEILSHGEFLNLGTVLHAMEDAFEPHHAYLYLGRAHSKYEGWVKHQAIMSHLCRQAPEPKPDYCSGYDLYRFFDPSKIFEFVSWSQFSEGFYYEDVVEDAAKRGAFLAYPDSDDEDRLGERATVWRGSEKEPEQMALEHDWWTVAAEQHNLSVAATVTMLKKAMSLYYDSWHARGYCDSLHASDPAQWRRIVPGPSVGEHVPKLGMAGYLVAFDNAGTRHPYYNDAGENNSNEAFFMFPEPVFGAGDYVIDKAYITFSGREDWHVVEGDHLLVNAWVDDPASSCGSHRCLIEKARYELPGEVPWDSVEITAPHGTRLMGVQVKLVEGAGGPCTPTPVGFRFGFRVDEIDVEYHVSDAPLGGDVPSGLIEYWTWLGTGGLLERLKKWLGEYIQCNNPGPPCDEEFMNDVRDEFRFVLDNGGVMTADQIFDTTYEEAVEDFADPAISPPLVAYLVTAMAQEMDPGRSMVANGLVDTAVEWSYLEQGDWKGSGARDVVCASAGLDMSRPSVENRRRSVVMNGWGLPAVEVPDMTGYPGFRPPTQAELGDRSSMLSYLEEKDADIEKYRAHRLLEIARENVEGFIRIIDTYVGDDPVEMQRLSDVRARLVEERNFLETAGDGDGDGVLLDEDLCPEECARGMDADLDGCIDRACGLKEEVLGTQMWWVARMVLLQKARLACWMDKRNKPRAAAGLLWAFGRLVRNFTRIGWIAPGDGERLQTFAKNARNAVLGYMGSLNCAPAGGWMEESRPARTNKPRPGVNRARPASARMR